MSQHTAPAETRGYGWKAAEWLLGVIGGVAVFLGLFIMFGSENEHVGLGGDLAWRVGDISSAWMYGLLIGGLVCLAGLVYMLFAGRSRTRLPATPRGDLLWHTGVFIVVNAFVWAQDFAISTGLDYAYLITIPWGMGLAIHASRYFLGKRREEETPVEFEPVEADRKEFQPH
jgi:hypothetical protein